MQIRNTTEIDLSMVEQFSEIHNVTQFRAGARSDAATMQEQDTTTPVLLGMGDEDLTIRY